jgi:dihydroxyacid dehydratase/phosphogluconate dehydratase
VTQQKSPIASLHTGVAEVTERIRSRSQHTRHDYLARMRAARRVALVTDGHMSGASGSVPAMPNPAH